MLHDPDGKVKVLGGVQEVVLDLASLFTGVKSEYVPKL